MNGIKYGFSSLKIVYSFKVYIYGKGFYLINECYKLEIFLHRGGNIVIYLIYKYNIKYYLYYFVLYFFF